jgi:AAA domain
MLKRISDDKRIDGTQLFLYSENGAGKTFAAAGAGDDWVFITDRNGIATVKSKLFKEKVGTDPFLLEITPDDSPTVPKMFDSIRNQIDMLLAPATKNDFRGIILDDLNSIRIGARNKAIDLNGSLGRSKSGVNAQSGKFKDILIPTISDFGTEMGLTDSFLRQLTEGLREEGKHSIVCAHQRLYRKQGDNTIIAIKPLLTGTDTPDSIPGLFDLVWYLRVVGNGSASKREFVTDNEGGIMAKTRWSGLFKNIERDITMKEVFARIEKWQSEGKI